MRLGQQRLLLSHRFDGRRFDGTARRGEARGHELAQERNAGGVTGGGRRDSEGLEQDVVAWSAVEDVKSRTADQHIIAEAAIDGVVAGAADQNIVAITAILREREFPTDRTPG